MDLLRASVCGGVKQLATAFYANAQLSDLPSQNKLGYSSRGSSDRKLDGRNKPGYCGSHNAWPAEAPAETRDAYLLKHLITLPQWTGRRRNPLDLPA